MKRICFILAFMLSTLCGFASDLVEGSLAGLRGEGIVEVAFDYSQVKYLSTLGIEDIIDYYHPEDGWEKACAHNFIEEFNDKSIKVGLLGRYETTKECRYILIICPMELLKSGRINGYAFLVNRETNQREAVMSYSIEGDDDDDIIFGDSMKDLGNSLGRLIKNRLYSNN